MARTTSRPTPTATRTLPPLGRHCPRCGETMWAAYHHSRTITTLEDVEGTHIANPKAMWQYAQMVCDSTPEFYLEHLRRLRKSGIQPYFALASIYQLAIVERLVSY